MINIVIRTCYRPTAFLRCIHSVIEQRVPVNIIIGYDDERAMQYLRPTLMDAVRPINDIKIVSLVNYKRTGEFFYNGYLNELLQYVKPGHVIFLDDDDALSPNVLSRLNLSEGKSYITKFRRDSGVQRPPEFMFCEKIIAKGHIGMPCLILSTVHIRYVQFDETEFADFNVMYELSKRAPLSWLNVVLVKASERSRGKKE